MRTKKHRPPGDRTVSRGLTSLAQLVLSDRIVQRKGIARPASCQHLKDSRFCKTERQTIMESPARSRRTADQTNRRASSADQPTKRGQSPDVPARRYRENSSLKRFAGTHSSKCGAVLILRNREDPGQIRAIRRQCKRWSCGKCRRIRETRWSRHLGQKFKHARALWCAVIRDGSDWGRVRKQLGRSGAEYARITTPVPGTRIVIATAQFEGSNQLAEVAAVPLLEQALAESTGCRPVSVSIGWKLERDPVKRSQWELAGKTDLPPAAIQKAAEEQGAEAPTAVQENESDVRFEIPQRARAGVCGGARRWWSDVLIRAREISREWAAKPRRCPACRRVGE